MGGTEEKSCQQFTLRKQSKSKTIIWKGVMKQNDTEGVADHSNGEKEDISSYDKNVFQWYCSKDETPLALQQAALLMDPPAGNISTKSTKILVKVTLTNSFPFATSKLYLQNEKLQACSPLQKIEFRAAVSNFTCIYTINLKTRETLFTILVNQDGFRKKTFEYRVKNTNLKKNEGQNR